MLPSRGRKFYSEFKPNGSGKRLCSCAQRNQALLSSPAFRAMGTGASTAFERGYKYLAPLTASVLPKGGDRDYYGECSSVAGQGAPFIPFS